MHFLKLDKNLAKPYFTGFTADLTIHSEPIITIGLIRSFLSGGILDLHGQKLIIFQ